MENLKRLIENEKLVLQLSPVVSANVRRVCYIKDITPSTLIDYCLQNDIEHELSFGTISADIKIGKHSIVLMSKSVKVTQSWSE